jgi:hypothetical protein
VWLIRSDCVGGGEKGLSLKEASPEAMKGLGGSTCETMLVDSQPLDFRVERLPRKSQLCGCAGWA